MCQSTQLPTYAKTTTNETIKAYITQEALMSSGQGTDQGQLPGPARGQVVH